MNPAVGRGFDLVKHTGRNFAVCIAHKGRGDTEHLVSALGVGESHPFLLLQIFDRDIPAVQSKGIPVNVRLLPDKDVFLHTVSGHGVFHIRAVHNIFKQKGIPKRRFQTIRRPFLKPGLNALIPLLSILSDKRGNAVHSLLHGKQLVVIFFTAEPGNKTVSAVPEMPSVLFLRERVVYVFIFLCVFIEHMNRFGIKHRLLASVAHTEHLAVLLPQLGNFADHKNRFHRLFRNDFRVLKACGVRPRRSFFFRREIHFLRVEPLNHVGHVVHLGNLFVHCSFFLSSLKFRQSLSEVDLKNRRRIITIAGCDGGKAASLGPGFQDQSF